MSDPRAPRPVTAAVPPPLLDLIRVRPESTQQPAVLCQLAALLSTKGIRQHKVRVQSVKCLIREVELTESLGADLLNT